MGFRGTVTFSWDTLLGVIMDTFGSLADHGVNRFIISNHHGGNTNVMNLAIQLAKREFGVMVANPRGPSDTELAKIQSERSRKYWDVHSGVNETGAALSLFPELVEMWRIPDNWEPSLSIDEKLMKYFDPEREDYEVGSQVKSASSEPDTDDFSDDGIYGLNDPRNANPEEAKKRFEERVNFFVEFIKLWKTIPTPPAYK
jgi:creatinine amidohydrolase/Fe(II)-dependent formamide hydrolase-like protein